MKKKMTKVLQTVLLIGLIVQTGFATFAMINKQTNEPVSDSTDLADEGQSLTTAQNITVSQEVEQKIKESDPVNFDKNLSNYRNLLISLNVHPAIQSEIEQLILQDYKVWNVMIAYEYLYHQFGTVSDLKNMLEKNKQGASWVSIFTEFKQADQPFVPRAFESDELEKLLNSPGIDSDDIMIADRVSFESGTPLEELINSKMEDQNWQQINAGLQILYSNDQLPRVPVTSDQLEKFTQLSGMTEQQIVEAFVLAEKVGKTPEEIIERSKNGATEEAVFAESYIAKYR